MEKKVFSQGLLDFKTFIFSIANSYDFLAKSLNNENNLHVIDISIL